MDFHGNKRVLIIVQNLPLPFDRRVWQEANTLIDNGYDVHIICPKGSGIYGEEYECINKINIFRHELPLEAKGLPAYFMEYYYSLKYEKKLAKKIFKELGFDFIQICNPPDLLYLVAKKYKKKYGVKLIFDHHDINPELYIAKFGRKDLFYRMLLFFEKRTFNLADHCIATNESYKKIAISRGGKGEKEVTVVRSGPSLKWLSPVPADEKLKKGKKYLVSYVGVLGQQEGIPYLLQAVKRIKETHMRNDVHFLIMGEGPVLEDMMSLSKEMNLTDIVEFPGRVSDGYLRTALSSSDICVNPDEYNEMNNKSTMNKIMEYMAMGKPIVQFDLSEGRYSAEEASLYAKPNNAEDFSDKIVYLLDHPEEREYMGNYGKNRVEKNLIWEHEAPKFLKVYNDLC